MPDGSTAQTWRFTSRSRWWAAPYVVIALIWFGFWVIALGDALLEAQWSGLVAVSIPGVLGGVVLLGAVRQFTCRVELLTDGVTIVNFVRPKHYPWVRIARVEIDEVDVPKIRGRGPCLILVLTDRKRIRLWATEQWGWGYYRRLERLELLAEELRRARRDHDAPTN